MTNQYNSKKIIDEMDLNGSKAYIVLRKIPGTQ